MKLSLDKLSNILQISKRRTRRLSKKLFLIEEVNNHTIFYNIKKEHPLFQSIKLCRGIAKPLYTITDLSKLWVWRKNYSTESVRQLLSKYDIPVQHGKGKGYRGVVYLVDLLKLNDIYKD